jgi:argininosuccinate synthase
MTQHAVLAFSGGLDTSYCLVALRERGWQVTTVTVNTGGLVEEQASEIEHRALELGAARHESIDARGRLYSEFVAYLLKANYLRNGAYPSCVGVERMIQAEEVTKRALALGADAIVHGSTGAGNDHVRFDVVIKTLAPDLKIMAIVRDESRTREAETEYLTSHGVDVPEKTTTYSINSGMLGTTIGGAETYNSAEPLPEDAWPTTRSIAAAPDEGQELTIVFEAGLPVGCDFPAGAPAGWPGRPPSGYELLEALNELGAVHGVGRGMHTGQTIMGIIGRIGFEAPGYFVITAAHRELERLVLSGRQQAIKAQLGTVFGDLLHEAFYYDPIMADLEVFLDSTQVRVSGSVRIKLHKGNILVLGSASPHSLLDATRGLGSTYGHRASLWSGPDAKSYASLYATAGIVTRNAGGAGAG